MVLTLKQKPKKIKKSETVLSAKSLGLTEKEKQVGVKTYRRNGMQVKLLKRPRPCKRFMDVVIAPRKLFYPYPVSSFTFGKDTIDANHAIKLVPNYFNPAIWIHREKKLISLRVPKDREKDTHKALYKQDFWYHTVKREWYKRRLHRKK